MTRPFTEDQDEWLREHHSPKKTIRVLTGEYNAQFGEDRGVEVIKHHCRKLGLKQGRYFTPDQDEWLRARQMQVDHFLPLKSWGIEDAGTDDISNLMPSCRMCNHYKRANTLETFRRYIEEIPRKLRSDYIFKVGVVYGNVIENEKPIKFYFEKQDGE